jgi:hypothetical protein
VTTALIVTIVVLAAAALFWLAWWTSGRSKGLGRRSGSGDLGQDLARFEATVQKTTRGGDSFGSSGGSP